MGREQLLIFYQLANKQNKKMEKQTKILLGIATLVAIAYYLYTNKKTVANTNTAEIKPSVIVNNPSPISSVGNSPLIDDIPSNRVICPDGSTDVSNGIVAPCLGHGNPTPLTDIINDNGTLNNGGGLGGSNKINNYSFKESADTPIINISNQYL